jgi:hypothetical protein
MISVEALSGIFFNAEKNPQVKGISIYIWLKGHHLENNQYMELNMLNSIMCGAFLEDK